MARIALVGIGTMGLPMGRNLLAAGHEVIGCDREPARVALLGTAAAETPAEAAARADMVQWVDGS